MNIKIILLTWVFTTDCSVVKDNNNISIILNGDGASIPNDGLQGFDIMNGEIEYNIYPIWYLNEFVYGKVIFDATKKSR